MFTTELATRVFVTVLLLGPIGLCHSQKEQEDIISIYHQKNWARTAENKRTQDEDNNSPKSRLLASDEEPGILLPDEDKYNFVGDDDQSSSTTQSAWRKGRTSPYPATTIVSTNSYSIRPDNSGHSSSSSSSLVFNTKPMSIITTGTGYTVKSTSPSSQYSGGSAYSPYSNNKNSKDKTTIYVKNNCFGPRCSTSSSSSESKNHQQQQQQQQKHSDDEWKSYHYMLNKDAKQKMKRYQNQQEGATRRQDFGELVDVSTDHRMTLSVPFIVKPAVSEKERYEYEPYGNQNRNNRRISRTTTTTPGWIKLQPIIPNSGQYDPFSLNGTRRLALNSNNERYQEQSLSNQNSQFSDRLGLGEINPDSFAERWGWNDPPLNLNEKGSGSRLPSWLQEVHNGLHGGPNRDSDNKNWVKLDPIPVAGVTISKWVPKGTPNSELPTTNWPSRDPTRDHSNRPSYSNGNNNSPPPGNTKWWDIIDSINRLHRPSYIPQSPTKIDHSSHHGGWGPPKAQSSSSGWDRTPQNPWNEIVYPEGPGSATVSWQQDKDLSKYSSSFPMSPSSSSSSSSSWPSNQNIRRPSATATGSWSADRGNTQYESNPYGGNNNRRYGSSSYPDRSINEDDPRWVLVSNSRKVTVAAPQPQHISSHGYHDGKRYQHSAIDKYGDFPFYEPPYTNHRIGKSKDYNKDSKKNLIITNEQDDAFYKVNATLANLTPVLSLRGSSTHRTPDLNSIVLKSPTTTTTKPPKKLPAFLKPYTGDGRSSNNATYNIASPSEAVQKFRNRLSINPVYAAVGAGMIPATMAAVLPMVLGRRRRDLLELQLSDKPNVSKSIKSFYQRLASDAPELESFEKSLHLKPPITKYIPDNNNYDSNNIISSKLSRHVTYRK